MIRWRHGWPLVELVVDTIRVCDPYQALDLSCGTKGGAARLGCQSVGFELGNGSFERDRIVEGPAHSLQIILRAGGDYHALCLRV